MNKHAQALGRLGGKAKTEKKSASCRENGKLGGRPISLFVCPACGGEHFGRDIAQTGKIRPLRTVCCHTPGCGWRGQWPQKKG
jgi:hypothetical protein